MDTTLVKFLILWIMCENIVFTTSMAVTGIANEDANTRQKRSPSNNFSFFGLNLGSAVTTARKSFSGIRNAFSGSRGNTHQNNYHEPIETFGNVRNHNTFSPIDFPSRSGIPNSRAQDDFQKEERYVFSQESKNEGLSTTIPDKKQNTNEITVPERNYEATENTSENTGNGAIDKQLLEYIFRNSQFNYDGASTTVNDNIYFVTETGEYETTTDILDNRIQLPSAAVATLLG